MGTKNEIRRLAKRMLAAVLFVLLLMGGGAAAFTALAAGISALSDASANLSTVQVVSVTPGTGLTQGVQSPSSSLQAPNQTSGVTNETKTQSNIESPYGTPSASVTMADQWDYNLSHMHSPVGDAVDAGGVVIGQKVQQVFGGLLSGLLQTLFLEQNDTPSGAVQK